MGARTVLKIQKIDSAAFYDNSRFQQPSSATSHMALAFPIRIFISLCLLLVNATQRYLNFYTGACFSTALFTCSKH